MKIEVKKINGELALKVPYDEDLIAKLMYGTGMRVSEAIGLRIQDIDFGQNEIIIKRGKGDKDRCTMLPGALKTEIKDQMEKVKKIHEQDLKDGFGGGVKLPDLIAKKYPIAAKDFLWTVCSDFFLTFYLVLCVSV